jgi:hypothetical protein
MIEMMVRHDRFGERLVGTSLVLRSRQVGLARRDFDELGMIGNPDGTLL